MIWVVFGSSMFAYCSRAVVESCPAPVSSRHSLFHETPEDSLSEQLNCSTKLGMSMHTVAQLGDFPQDSRILRHNPEQRTRSARGGSTTLFPVLQCAHRDPKQLSKLRL
jgi:hypothetical protein